MKNTFGHVLRQHRLRRELSQVGVATLAGLEQAHLCGIECGYRSCSLEMAIRIAKALEAARPGRSSVVNDVLSQVQGA